MNKKMVFDILFKIITIGMFGIVISLIREINQRITKTNKRISQRRY